jgi:hypothetical protein
LDVGPTWQRGLAGAGYACLAAGFLVLPFTSYLFLLALLVASDWRSMGSAIPLLRSRRTGVVLVGWLAWATIVLLAGLVSAFAAWFAYFGVQAAYDPATFEPSTSGVLDLAWWLVLGQAFLAAPTAVVALVLCVWNLSGEHSMGLIPTTGLVTRLVTLWLLPELGIANAKMMTRAVGWRSLAWGLAVVSWVSLHACILAIVVIARPQLTWSGLWSALGGDLVRYAAIGLLLLATAWIVRQGYLSTIGEVGPPPPARDRGANRRTPKAHERVRRTVFVLTLFGAWLIPQGLALCLWWEILHDRIASFVVVLVAATPMGIVSSRGLALAAVAAITGAAMPRDTQVAARSLGGALIVAIAVVFTGASVQPFDPWAQSEALILVGGACVGMSAAVSAGVARALGGGALWVEVSSGFVATLFCGALTFELIFTFQPALSWLATCVLGTAGLGLGYIAGYFVLVRGFSAFLASARFLEELFWPLVGFVTGYVFILLTFGGLYFAMYEHVDLVPSVSTAPLFTGPPAGQWQLDDFIYLSFTTIAPGQESDVKPLPGHTWLRLLTGTELALGIGWTVIVFGALLAHLTDRHTRQLVREELEHAGDRQPVDAADTDAPRSRAVM